VVKSALHIRSKNLFAYLFSFAVVVVLFSFLVIDIPTAKAASDTCTWSGSGADSNITTAGNWTGCDNSSVPESGDDVVFPAGPTNKTVTLDAQIDFSDVTFSGSGYTVETTNLPDYQLYITSTLTISGDNNTFNPFVRFFNDSGVTLTHSGTGTVFSEYIVIQPGAGDPDVTLDIQSDMSVPMIAQTTGSVGLVSKTGTGTLDITGSSITGMTATNGIEISAGRWKCDTQHCLGSESNLITLSAGGVPASAVIEFAQPNLITVASIIGDGKIAMTNVDAHVRVGNGNASGTFSGTVDGYADSLIEIIGGTWTFTGTNTDGGNGFSSYYVNGGTFIARAADTSLGLSPFSMSSGVLGGTDLIGRLSAYGGTVAPGNSPGCLYPAGDVAFTADASHLAIEIDGTTACTGYDVLNASGDVALNNAVLDVSVLDNYSSTYGNTFTIVQGQSVNGTFNGLADGDTFTVGNNEFRINYTSNSVTLTDITPEQSATISTLASTGSSIYPATLLATSLLALAGYFAGSRRSSRLSHKK